MAERYAVATGNWSDTATWDGGTLPGVSDDVYSNTYTVTIDQNVTVLSIRNGTGTTAAAGGGFAVSGAYTITADLVCHNADLLTCTNASGVTVQVVGNLTRSGTSASQTLKSSGLGNILITGDIVGGTQGSGFNNWGVDAQVANDVTIVGDVTGGTGIRSYGVYKSSGTLTITGNCVGTGGNGTKTNPNPAVRINSATATINGNCTGGSVAYSAGCYVDSGTLTLNGNAIASTSVSGVYCGSPANTKLILNGDLTSDSNGRPAVVMGSEVLIDDTATLTHTYREDNSGTAGDARTLSTAGADQANPADVRSGTSYNQGASTGTLVVPDAAYVSLGVPVDATVGTLTGASLASGTAQGGTSTTIQLAASETFGDDILNGNIVKITGGTGAGQSRRITDYVGATDTATVHEAWTTNPDNTSTYEVVEGSHVTGISQAEVNAACDTAIADAALATAAALATVDTVVDNIQLWTHRIATKEFGVISNAASPTEQFVSSELGITVTYAGLDSDGNRTGVAFS